MMFETSADTKDVYLRLNFQTFFVWEAEKKIQLLKCRLKLPGVVVRFAGACFCQITFSSVEERFRKWNLLP